MIVICKDLADEYAELDAMVTDLEQNEWNQKTPYFNWTIKDEISHISYFDSMGLLAISDSQVFEMSTKEMLRQLPDESNRMEMINAACGDMSTQKLLTSWRKNRDELIANLRLRKPEDKIPWYELQISPKNLIISRIMETWAHAQDVADTLGIQRIATDRLKYIADLGVSTLESSFTIHQKEAPEESVFIELTGPSGATWSWGPEDAENSVKGSAEEFCLVVTQRRNITDTKLHVEGNTASEWMSIAQAFTGPAKELPKPGQRAVEY